MSYQSTKRISGLSTCFRQHGSNSHCSMLHGYALEFILTFEADILDENNWVMDFGFLKELTTDEDGKNISFRDWFKKMFDHTTIVSRHDPEITSFLDLHEKKVLDLRVLDKVGCEYFARYVFQFIHDKTITPEKGAVQLISVECIENKNNSAIFKLDYGR